MHVAVIRTVRQNQPAVLRFVRLCRTEKLETTVNRRRRQRP